MNRPALPAPAPALIGLLLWACAAAAQTDPPDLQIEPPKEEQPAAAGPLRLAAEVGTGRVELGTGERRTARRASLDLRLRSTFGPHWRFELSDRFDYLEPELPGQGRSSNSLREAFIGWQSDEQSLTLDGGRVNHRQGPAFGFNPTDYFRHGALRALVTADPVALRERRLGTVMLRGGWLAQGGSVTLALAPKLADAPNRSAASLDLGSTNGSSRALLSVGRSFGEALNAQASLYQEDGESPQLGLNFTQLVGGSLVVFGELSGGKQRALIDRVLPSAAPQRGVTQAALGFTFSFPSALALTIEADYNGAGLDASDWRRLVAAGPVAQQRYLALTQASQELGPRRSWLAYVSQKGIGWKQLDLTAFLRTNAVDHSRLAWAELRYHWTRIDGVLQWQRHYGAADSEARISPVRSAVQISVVVYL